MGAGEQAEALSTDEEPTTQRVPTRCTRCHGRGKVPMALGLWVTCTVCHGAKLRYVTNEGEG